MYGWTVVLRHTNRPRHCRFRHRHCGRHRPRTLLLDFDDSVELQSVAIGVPHEWTYRGQVLGHRERVTVEAHVTTIDDARRRITADGRLVVDGLWIYAMKDFTIELVPAGGRR